jgi:hypothetical protein
MNDQFGISFAPTGQPGQGTGGATGPSESSPVADAIKVLSLRIPRVVGPGGLAPGGLLNGMGGGGMQGMSGVPGGLEELLRRLFGQGGAQTGAGTPKVTPGVTGPGGSPVGPLSPPPPAAPPQAPVPPPAPPPGGDDVPHDRPQF